MNNNSRFSNIAFRSFFVWGVLCSLGVTAATFIDAILVGNFVGSDGLAVVNIATPVFMIYTLIAYSIGYGANVIIGRLLGSTDVDDACRTFSVQVILAVISGLVFVILALFFKDPVISFLGGGNGLHDMTSDYLFVVLLCAPIFIVYQVLAASIRTDADPKLVSVSAGVVIVVDFVLDIVFMYYMHMGTLGASLSLCISEIAGLGVLLLHFRKKRALLHFGFVKFNMREVTEILKNGIGMGSTYAFQAAYTVVFNIILVGADAGRGVLNVALFGIIYTMSTLPLAFFEGAANAVFPVVSIFTGEKDKPNVMNTQKLSIKYAVVCGIILNALMFIFAKQIIIFFGMTDAAYLPEAIFAFRLYTVSVAFAGINTVCLAFWQAIGRAKLSAVMSVMRNLVFMLAFGFLLIQEFEIKGLAITYICAEVACVIISLGVRVMLSSGEFIGDSREEALKAFEKEYPIQIESLEEVGMDCETICEEFEIGPKQSFFINLVIEELILNIIKIGIHEKGQGKYISIKIVYNDNDSECIVRIRDNVHSYNPFESEGEGDEIDAAAIKMIKQKTKYFNYQRKLAFNYLYFII